MVRPFGLAGPILVLLIALPLLRPLRHPSELEMSNQEMLSLASVEALVEHGSLDLDRRYGRFEQTVTVDGRVYSQDPPMLALLLWPAAWVMTQMGLSFDENYSLMAYLLTMLGAALPVAASAGFIYKMGRLFELRRPWRTLLGIGVVAASGLLSYAVVLNRHAPAAALVIASAFALIHVAAMNREDRRAGWFALAGACAALAATIDPPAVVFLVLFAAVIFAMRFSIPRRSLGVFLYILGAIPVLSVHTAWNSPITGDAIPASVHATLLRHSARPDVFPAGMSDEESQQRSLGDRIGSHVAWFTTAMFGRHGLFSHFPILVFGILGIAAVMHRHWPGSTKTLAAATGAGALVILFLYRFANVDWLSAMFATRWFIVFSPVLLFWTGAWLRRSHTPAVWGFAGIVFLFSLLVGLIGATGPAPSDPFRDYTAKEAFRRLVSPARVDLNTALAARSQ